MTNVIVTYDGLPETTEQARPALRHLGQTAAPFDMVTSTFLLRFV